MNVIKTSDRAARLADKRIRIVRDNDPREPHASSQMLFGILGGAYSIKIDDLNAELYNRPRVFEREVDGFKIWTTSDRIDQLCGKDAKYHSDEWLESQIKGELDEVKEFLEGHCYAIMVESWVPEEREWKIESSTYGYTGVKCVLDEVEGMLAPEGEGVVCSDCAELIS